MTKKLSQFIKSIFAKLPRFYRHDLFCQDVFCILWIARLILKCILSKEVQAELDLSKLEVVNDKFVTERLRALHSDMIYQIPMKNGNNLYLVIEFKTDNRRNFIIQLFRYFYHITMRILGKETGYTQNCHKVVFF
jgi:predicted transposase/invertase (TIGR01784 family)